MAEIFFLIAFAMTLLVTGLTTRGFLISIGVGLISMFVAGMLGMLVALLPWVILIAFGVWVFRGDSKKATYCRDYYQKYVARISNKGNKK